MTTDDIDSKIALAQYHEILNEGMPIWSYVCGGGQSIGSFFSHSPNYGLTLGNLSRAVELIIEFESALRAYTLMKD